MISPRATELLSRSDVSLWNFLTRHVCTPLTSVERMQRERHTTWSHDGCTLSILTVWINEDSILTSISAKEDAAQESGQ
jgi:hypothetical protein